MPERISDERLAQFETWVMAGSDLEYAAVDAEQDVRAIVTELQFLRAAVKQVGALHVPHEATTYVGESLCRECGKWWPCPTIRALRGEGDPA